MNRGLGRSLALLIGKSRRSPFVASLAVLSVASAISGAIGLAATPLISRLYTPAEFGVLGVFAAALSVVSVLATLRYDYAIPAANNDEEAFSILFVALTSVVGTSILCLVLLRTGIFDSWLSRAGADSLILTWALPLGMMCTGAYGALSNWMVRRRDYPTLAKTRLAQASSMVATQSVLGVLGAGSIGLILGQVAGSSAGILRLVREVGTRDRFYVSGIRVSRLNTVAKNYRQYPLLSGPAVLLDALTGALPMLAIATRFGPAAAGVFTIVQRVLVTPMSILTTSVSQVLFGDLAELRRVGSGTMMEVFYRRLSQLSLIGFLMIAAMIAVVPMVLPVVLGPRWENASTFFLILSPMLLTGFISAPFGFVIDVLRRQDLHFLRDAFRLIVMSAALAIAKATGMDIVHTLCVISVAGCINSISYLGISWYALVRMPKLAEIDVGQSNSEPSLSQGLD